MACKEIVDLNVRVPVRRAICSRSDEGPLRVDCGLPASIVWAARCSERPVVPARYGWGRHSVTAFGAGRLIQVAVGLARGTGALSTNRAGMLGERAIKRDLPGRVNSIHPAEMHLIRRHQADPSVVVILINESKNRRHKFLASSMLPNR